MKTRILSAIVAIAVFIGVVYFLPQICFTVAISVILAIGAYELVWRSKIVSSFPMLVTSCAFAAAFPFVVSLPDAPAYIFVLMFSCLVVLFTIWLFNFGKVSLVMMLTSFFAGAVIPLLFSFIVPIRLMENGQYMLLFPFVAAWMTDTGAYFAGSFFGRHKLCEKISPKKTVEGAVGGVITCIISVFAFAKIMEGTFEMTVNYPVVLCGALVLSVIAQIGDLSFSIIKREYNIKDYGAIMPGHGGVLDRFDSTIFTIPASYILLILLGGIL